MTVEGDAPAPWTAQRRDALLRAYERATVAVQEKARETRALHGGQRYQVIKPLHAERVRCRRAYWDALPIVPLSACPYCSAPLLKAFDPLGLEGYFWQESLAMEPVEPAPCPHFTLLLGAVNLEGLPAQGGEERAHVGPEVPYVVPRVLSLPTMVAVVSTVPLANGYTTYPIAYYAETMPPPDQLTHSWTQTTHSWEDDDGEAWTVRNDAWDFELAPWVAKDKLRWIERGDASLKVVAAPEPCPYLDVSGRRGRLVIKADELVVGALPRGDELDSPFE